MNLCYNRHCHLNDISHGAHADGVAVATGGSVSDTAVIGMSCRLPGGIASSMQLWEALLSGRNYVKEFPSERLDENTFLNFGPASAGRTQSSWGAFLDDVSGFDANFFGLSTREAEAIDPQHRLLMEASFDAIEHAGIDPAALRESNTGVFIGIAHSDGDIPHIFNAAERAPYSFAVTSTSFASSGISRTLNLHGPAVTIDTACSSGLVAIHQARQSLHLGESDLAIAGGVSITLDPQPASAGSTEGILSPTGRCQAFDVGADGFTVGEACVVFVLKQLDAALADGDRVLAVIKGSATNNDGHTSHIPAPSGQAQQQVALQALAAANMDPDSIGFVEAHGTGTPVGDPIEYASLATVYGRQSSCVLGSVKTNFGHTQSAAGPLGLLKTILSLQHGVVPANLHFTRLPEGLAQLDTKLFVPQHNTKWPAKSSNTPRRAAVCCYSLSGTNAHLIVEQAPRTATDSPVERKRSNGASLLFPVSANSDDQLRAQCAKLADWIGTEPGISIHDIGYTLARRRHHRTVRTVIEARDRGELSAGLQLAASDVHHSTVVTSQKHGPVWIFSGQSSQRPDVTSELLAREPIFAKTIGELEHLIWAESSFSVTQQLTTVSPSSRTELVQPTVFAFQIALAKTMSATYGIKAGAVIGHSLGEVAAAVVAGGLSLQDGVRVVCRRSRLMSMVAGSGAMAAVGLPAQQVLADIASRGIDNVDVAVVAAPSSTVVSGDRQRVQHLVEYWTQQGWLANVVAVDAAPHSPQVVPILELLTEELADIAPRSPEIPYFSTTLFDPCEHAHFDAAYWRNNLRHTVRFSNAVEDALGAGFRVFGELSTNPLLAPAVNHNAASLGITSFCVLLALPENHALANGLAGFAAALYKNGATVDFSAHYPVDTQLVDVPQPAWSHRRIPLKRDTGQQRRSGHAHALHPLLGVHIHLREEPERHLWQAEMGSAFLPRQWLQDHQVHGVPVFPASAYAEMALAAAGIVVGDSSEVTDLRFEQPLVVGERQHLSTEAMSSETGRHFFRVHTARGGENVVHASAVLQAAKDSDHRPEPYDLSTLRINHPLVIDLDYMQAKFRAVGIDYGPSFRGLTELRFSDNAADTHLSTLLAAIQATTIIDRTQKSYVIHPALLDACFQSSLATPETKKWGDDSLLLLPVHIARIRRYDDLAKARQCFTQVKQCTAEEIVVDVDVLDDSGAVLLRVSDLRFRATSSQTELATRTMNSRLLSIEWVQKSLSSPQDGNPGAWLLLASDSGSEIAAAGLGASLQECGARWQTLTIPADDDAATDEYTAMAGLHSALTMFGDSRGTSGVVVVVGRNDNNRESTVSKHVKWVTRIARAVAEYKDTVPRLFVYTRNAAVVDGDTPNLAHAGLRGLLRAIDAEHPQLATTWIDVDMVTGWGQIAPQILLGGDEDEIAWRDGKWWCARLRPAPLTAADRRHTLADNASEGWRMRVSNAGDPDTVEVVASPRQTPKPGHVEVRVEASSMNFVDVLVARGRYPSFGNHQQQLGLDFAGTITAVGADVVEHRVGDRVAGISQHGCWGNFVIADSAHTIAVPPHIALSDAAALPCATATAWYSLHNLARIAPGDKVLIHAGAGGVGQAAIAVARAAGADIYATAGSEKRRAALREQGIAHVYDSGTTEFAEQIRADTNGYGIDIVINSLPGAAQRASIDLLALGGRFVELGKHDIDGDHRIGLAPFKRNLSLFAVDFSLLTRSHPHVLKQLLRNVFDGVAAGDLTLPPISHRPIDDAAAALRRDTDDEHVGKIVFNIDQSGATAAVIPPEQAQTFRADGAYIVSGGLRGLGLFIAGKMADAGAGRIVLNARSMPDQKASETIEMIRSLGCDVVVECGDIAQPETARRLVAAATATGLSVRGVLHAAAIVDDATLVRTTDELIERVWAPKVTGAWHLHEACTGHDLDWFCMFSSTAALVGSPGQVAHAAANSWLDAFAHWRRALNLPANCIAWAEWAEVGRSTAFAEQAGAAINPDEGFHVLSTLLARDRAYSGYAPIRELPRLKALAQRSRFAEAFQDART